MGFGKSIRLRTSIYRTCAGKDESFDTMTNRGIDQCLRFRCIVVKVSLGEAYGLSNFYVARKMDYRPGTV